VGTDHRATDDRLLEELARLRERLAGLEDAERRWRATEAELRQSRRMLQLVLDTIPVRVFWKDRDCVYVGCNLPLARDCGYDDPAELVGKTDFETASAPTAEAYRADDLQVMASGQPKLDYEEPQVKPDGSPAWLRTSKVPLRDEEGRVIGVLGTYEDVTERKLAQAALEERTAELDRFFSLALDLLCIVDVEGRFLRLNPAWGQTLGYSVAELEGQRYLDFVHPDDREATAAVAGDLANGQAVINFVNRYRCRDGSYRFIEWRSSPYQNRLVYAAARDITERRRTEEERRRLEAQLLHAQKLESLGVLAGGIAHDFNNLLVALLGNAELAMAELPPVSPVLPYLRNIEAASCRAAELCRQMLAYSGRGSFVVEALDLSEVVRETTHMLEVAISKKARLRFNLADGLPAVEVDATQVRQVVMNLITNASEALGDRSGEITLSTAIVECDRAALAATVVDDGLPAGRYVVLEVADTGCGMTPEVQRRLFDPFFSTKFAGRGLGMAAVLGIVRGHRGAIRVESAFGRGTRVRVLFPASREAACSRPDRTSLPRGGSAGGTVLVVDDDDNVRPVTRMMLERLGFQVLLAGDGREGLGVFRAHQGEIVCVLLDLTMPEMDGEETLAELREVDPQVRVILASGYNQLEVVQRFAGPGLAGFVQKPYRLADLRATLEKTLGR
jgi:PAS domain S-box-containing protein